MARCIENFVLLCMHICGVYMHCTFLTGRVRGRFYRLELKMEMVFLENLPWRLQDYSMMKTTAVYLKSKERTLDICATYIVNGCQGKVAGFFSDLTSSMLQCYLVLHVTQLLNSSQELFSILLR